jgi:hypothetical protein
MTKMAEEYYKLLERLWQVSVADVTGYREQFLVDLTLQMNNTEQLWLPISDFAHYKQQITELIDSDILIASPNNEAVGFRHQSFFEFCRAKAMLGKASLLSSYVIERQDSLLVRPMLWSSLKYLRTVDFPRYKTEFGSLWGNASLRFHIRTLLIEFVGQCDDPSDVEAEWLLSVLEDPRYRRRALASTAASHGWWQRLQHILPKVMGASTEVAQDMVPVLKSALFFDRSGVLDLLRRFWLPNGDNHFSILQVLDSNPTWDEPSVTIVCSVFSRTIIPGAYVDAFVSIIMADHPVLAPIVVRSRLDKLLEDARLLPKMEESYSDLVYSSDDRWPQLANRRAADPRQKRLIGLLDSPDWYLLPEVAEKEPQAFVQSVWPWLVTILTEIAHEPHQWINSYISDAAWSTNLTDIEGQGEQFSVVSALCLAIRLFAQQQPEAFLKFVCSEKHHEYLVLQRLLSKGLTELVESHAEAVLDFVLEDRRRLALGDSFDEHRESRKLINGLVPFLKEDQRSYLEQAILGWTQYRDSFVDPDRDSAEQRQQFTREHRMWLLRAYPLEFMSQETRRLFEKEQGAFPNATEADIVLKKREWIGSPKMPEEFQLVDEISDALALEKSEKASWLTSGQPRSLKNEFTQLVNTSPRRAIQHIRGLSPNVNQSAVGTFLEVLANNNTVSPRTVFNLIRSLRNAGFMTSSFAEHVGCSINTLLARGLQPTESVIRHLEGYLDIEIKDSAPYVRESGRDKTQANNSLLWSGDNFHLLPGGSFLILSTIAKACLMADPPKANRWLASLTLHLQRNESPHVWQSLAIVYLSHLRKADHIKAQEFLDSLFLKYPTSRDCREGTVLLAYLQSWTGEDSVERWLSAIKRSDWELGRQAYGELVMLHHLWFPDRRWARREVELVVMDARIFETQSDILMGISHTAAAAWFQPSCRAAAGSYLTKLLRLDNDEIFQSLSAIATGSRKLPKDKETTHFLAALSECPRSFQGSDMFQIATKLEDLVEFCPEEVCKVSKSIVKELKSQLVDHRTTKPLIAANLVGVAMTLQRLGEEYRERGLELFESMMELDVPAAISALDHLDCATRRQQPVMRLRRP